MSQISQIDAIMPTREETFYRQTPDNGHTLLLMETREEQRTFSDYPNVVTCLDTIMDMYEKMRCANNQDMSSYDLKQLDEWMDGFNRVEIFIFDKEIARYKRIPREGVKTLFIDQITKIGKSPDSHQQENGHNQADDNDSELDWDEA